MKETGQFHIGLSCFFAADFEMMLSDFVLLKAMFEALKTDFVFMKAKIENMLSAIAEVWQRS